MATYKLEHFGNETGGIPGIEVKDIFDLTERLLMMVFDDWCVVDDWKKVFG